MAKDRQVIALELTVISILIQEAFSYLVQRKMESGQHRKIYKDQQVLQVQVVVMAETELMARMEPTENQLRMHRQLQDQLDLRDRKVRKVQQDLQDPQVHRVPQDLRVQQALQGHLDQEVELQDRKVQQVQRVQQVQQVQRVQQVQQEVQVQLAQQVHKEIQDLQVLLEQPAQLEFLKSAL
jgi:predicted transcriptional regulator